MGGTDEWGSGRDICMGQWRRKKEMSGAVGGRDAWGSGGGRKR